MKKSLVIIVFGIAVGYVLGARAGRERYDQIVERATGIWQDPRVARARREAAQYAKEQAPVIAERAQAVAKAAPGALADAGKATAAAAKDVAGKTSAAAKDVADRAVSTAKDARDKGVTAATDAATRLGKARDNALEDTPEN